ncbi:HNH endonuclease signature motif containing protein [Streptomyces sp. NPDC045431]|uniref:HNH endonuclease n=1 Tax=Streptomyces sp. NPDC045431 TaxID=3155613 RepID=UPI0033F030F9
MLEANGGLCVYCQTRRSEEMDHVIPFAQGGADSLRNLVPSCSACNNRKGNRTPMEWAINTLMRSPSFSVGFCRSRYAGRIEEGREFNWR